MFIIGGLIMLLAAYKLWGWWGVAFGFGLQLGIWEALLDLHKLRREMSWEDDDFDLEDIEDGKDIPPHR